jgi:transcription elongation factor Elf1
MLNSTWYA